MAKTAYINQRIDAGLKTKAEKILRDLGVPAAVAITMFYRQVTLRKGLPFDVCIPNAETLAALREAEAGEGQTYAGSTEAAFDDALSK